MADRESDEIVLQRLPMKTADIPSYETPELTSTDTDFLSKQLNRTLEEAKNIEAATVGQKTSPHWMGIRLKRLTASHFG